MPKSNKDADEAKGDNETIAVDPKLLTALICPKTRGPLELSKDRSELISKKAKLAYPIREGVPIMLIDEARNIKS